MQFIHTLLPTTAQPKKNDFAEYTHRLWAEISLFCRTMLKAVALMNTLIHFQYESSLRFMEQKEEEAVFHRRTQPEYRKIAKRKNIRK